MKETAKAETPTRSTSDCAPSRPSITYQSILALQPDAHNPRTHSKRQIRRIADSIRTFGFTNPILVDEHGQVMAGHARLEAAKRLGLSQVPTIRIGNLSAAQKRAYLIADNRLAELSGWDEELLAIELQTLTTPDPHWPRFAGPQESARSPPASGRPSADSSFDRRWIRLIRLLLRAFAIRDRLERNPDLPLKRIAEAEGVSPSYATRALRLAYLAPDIVTAIIDGRQPPGPLIFTNISSRCHRQPENARIRSIRFLRISAAKIGPNRFHQNRIVSWLTSIPRS